MVLKVIQTYESCNAQPIESSLFGKSKGTDKTYRVAFQGFNDMKHFVAARATKPAWYDWRYERLDVEMDGKTTSIYVNKSSFKKRFSSSSEEFVLFRLTPLFKQLLLKQANLLSLEKISEKDIKNAQEIALKHSHTPIHTVKRYQETRNALCRTLLAGKEGQFLLFTRSKMNSDKILGAGAFGTVKYGLDLRTGKIVAAKICKQRTEARQDSIDCWKTNMRNEIALMEKSGDIEQVVKLIAHVEDTDKNESEKAKKYHRFYMVMEYCEGGDLFDAIDERAFSFNQRLRIAEDAAEGLQKLHSEKGIVHRDIKPENFLLTKDYHLRLADFGFACEKTDLEQRQLPAGTYAYFSPGVARLYKSNDANDHIATSIPSRDIWALGCTLYHLFSGNPLNFQNKVDSHLRSLSVITTLKQQDIDKEIEDSKIDPRLIPILKGTLQIDTKNQWNAEQVRDALKKINPA